MANQIEGVYDRLIEYAKEEFLKKGFKDASLRTIAKNADTSTGSIYTRFNDKAGLFSAIVQPAAEKFNALYYEEMKKHIFEETETIEEMLDYKEDKLKQTIDLIYDHYYEFKLLIFCSEGSGIKNFVEQLAKSDSKITLKYIKAMNNDAIEKNRLSLDLLNMLTNTFWTAIFKAIEHNMPKKRAFEYAKQIKRFYRKGWEDIFNSK